jgi:hypothetical protein
MLKRSRKARSASSFQLLLLVGDVLALAGLAHAVALDGLGEDHGRLALVVDAAAVGRVDLVRIVAAAVQAPDVVVGHVGDHRLELGILAEEVLARVGAADGLEVLVLAVDALSITLLQQAVCRARAADPSRPPQITLMTFQPAPRNAPRVPG